MTSHFPRILIFSPKVWLTAEWTKSNPRKTTQIYEEKRCWKEDFLRLVFNRPSDSPSAKYKTSFLKYSMFNPFKVQVKTESLLIIERRPHA